MQLAAPPEFQFQGSGPKDVNFPLSGYTFLGVFAIEDPPKPGVRESIASMRDAGCQTIMVTGDHPSTALAISRRIGILGDQEVVDTLSGENFAAITGAMISSQGLPPDDLTLAEVAMILSWRQSALTFGESVFSRHAFLPVCRPWTNRRSCKLTNTLLEKLSQ